MVPAMIRLGLWKTTARPVEPSNVPNYFQVTALAHADATFSQYLTADRINAAKLLRVLFPRIESGVLTASKQRTFSGTYNPL